MSPADIIELCMHRIPVGNLRRHTPDTLPDRVQHYVERDAQLGLVEDELMNAGMEFGDKETPVQVLRRLLKGRTS